MSLSLTILGCGSSAGVPRVAQGWGACDPDNPRNRRRRCSVLVARDGPKGRTQALVDTSPDLREQLIDANVASLDAVLISHEHADHTHGMDDLRPIYMAMRRRLDIYVDATTSEALRRKFGYIFATPPGSSYPPMAEERRIRAGEPIVVDGAGRPDRGDSLRPRPRRHRRARLPYRRPRLHARPQWRAASEPALARRARRLGRRRACATRRILRIGASTKRWRGSR